MKIVNDYIEKIGGADKMIHNLVGKDFVSYFAYVGFVAGVMINPLSKMAICLSTMCFVFVSLLLLAWASDWKERKDRKEQGNFYDRKDIEAAMLGGVMQTILIVIVLFIFVLV